MPPEPCLHPAPGALSCYLPYLRFSCVRRSKLQNPIFLQQQSTNYRVFPPFCFRYFHPLTRPPHFIISTLSVSQSLRRVESHLFYLVEERGGSSAASLHAPIPSLIWARVFPLFPPLLHCVQKNEFLELAAEGKRGYSPSPSPDPSDDGASGRFGDSRRTPSPLSDPERRSGQVQNAKVQSPAPPYIPIT